MSRPRLRMLFAVFIVATVVLLGSLAPQTMLVTAVVALLTQLGSKVLGRDFFRGRAAMDAGNYPLAIDHFQQFVRHTSPMRVQALKALWLGLYTSDPIALALNNIGACHVNLRNVEQAIAPLEEALQRDAGYAVPHANLAVLYALRGNAQTSERHATRAVELGYSKRALSAMLAIARGKSAIR